MRFEILIEPFEAYVFVTSHIFVYAGERETPLGAAYRRGILDYFQFGIDEHQSEIGTFGEAVGHGAAVDYGQCDGAAYLGSGEAYAVGVVHRLPHIVNQLVEVGIILGNVFGLFAQHRLADKIYG